MYDSPESLVDKLFLLFPANDAIWELDGLACGGICAGLANESLFLLMLKHSNSEVGQIDDPAALAEFIEERHQNLADFEPPFEPIIADEEANLKARVDSLILWCHGFLVGLESSGIEDLDDESIDIINIIESLSEGSGIPTEDEDEERNFFELLEFIKVGVSLIFLDLQTRLNNMETHDAN